MSVLRAHYVKHYIQSLILVVLNCQMGYNHQALPQCSVVFWLFAVSQGPVKKNSFVTATSSKVRIYTL